MVNAEAGNRRALQIARPLAEALGARGHDVRWLVVRSLAEAACWARGCEGGFACILGAGGDDTLAALSPAAMRLRAPLVPVPCGFGNTFARAVGHYPIYRDVAQLIEEGDVRWLDVGVDAGGIFLVTRGRGLIYQVIEAEQRAGRRPASRALRLLVCMRLAARILRDAPLPAIRVEVEGEPLAQDASLAIVANVPTISGFLNMTPSATPADGLLDVLAVPRTTKLGLLAVFFAFLLQLPHRQHLVQYRRGRRVSVGADGEAPEELELLPRALPVLVPPQPAWPSPRHGALKAAGRPRAPIEPLEHPSPTTAAAPPPRKAA